MVNTLPGNTEFPLRTRENDGEMPQTPAYIKWFWIKRELTDKKFWFQIEYDEYSWASDVIWHEI